MWVLDGVCVDRVTPSPEYSHLVRVEATADSGTTRIFLDWPTRAHDPADVSPRSGTRWKLVFAPTRPGDSGPRPVLAPCPETALVRLHGEVVHAERQRRRPRDEGVGDVVDELLLGCGGHVVFVQSAKLPFHQLTTRRLSCTVYPAEATTGGPLPRSRP